MFRRLGIALALVVSTACAHSKIPRTNIDDTEENREILAIVQEYQRAMVSRDSAAVLALVSPRFYEDNGNIDRADDYDYQGLATQLGKDFERTKAMQLEVRVDAIEVEEESAFAEIYYTYRAHNEYPAGMQWDTGTDRTRLRFERSKDGKWLIIGGL
ncbi:nuclear transport factor 2 family protein [Myxococcota bacterium]|nr:nuclear transport factor 2 family protein [Myxococcota bacterium]